MSSLHSIILAGGQGTRFWPLSTQEKPKQYHSFDSELSLLQETHRRLEGLSQSISVLTVEEQEGLVQDQLPQVQILQEPMGCNTGPCLWLALELLEQRGVSQDDILFFCPSDHMIKQTEKFQETVKRAQTWAQQKETLCLIGIPATSPHTGFGYIEKGADHADAFEVKAFKEKPDLKTAQSYVDSGNYLWNAGMFMGSLKVFKQKFQELACDIAQPGLLDSEGRVRKEVYASLPKISFDHAVLEKMDSLLMTPATFDWNDLGSWNALPTVLNEEEGNYFLETTGKKMLLDAQGNIVKSDKRVIALVDVQDLIIVDHDDVLMILPRKSDQRVKELS